MTAAQTAREFTKLRALQRLLRYYEEEHGPVCGVHFLRKHVIEEMRRIAKLMKYSAAAGVVAR